jgi:hypothetical protein
MVNSMDINIIQEYSRQMLFMCPKEFRAYYVIPPGVRPSVRPSVSNLVSGA